VHDRQHWLALAHDVGSAFSHGFSQVVGS